MQMYRNTVLTVQNFPKQMMLFDMSKLGQDSPPRKEEMIHFLDYRLLFIWTKSLRKNKVKIYAETAETYISTNTGNCIKKNDSVFIWHCKISSDKDTMVWSYVTSFERTGYKERLVSYSSPNHNPCSGFNMWGRVFWETEGSINVALSHRGQFFTVSVSVWHFLNLLQGQSIYVGLIVDF